MCLRCSAERSERRIGRRSSGVLSEVLDQLADLMVHFDGEQPEGNEFELILVDNFFEELLERVGN